VESNNEQRIVDDRGSTFSAFTFEQQGLASGRISQSENVRDIGRQTESCTLFGVHEQSSMKSETKRHRREAIEWRTRISRRESRTWEAIQELPGDECEEHEAFATKVSIKSICQSIVKCALLPIVMQPEFHFRSRRRQCGNITDKAGTSDQAHSSPPILVFATARHAKQPLTSKWAVRFKPSPPRRTNDIQMCHS
jgi:hypothetical protein